MKFVKPSKFNNFLNIRSVVVTANNSTVKVIAAVNACAVACTVNAGFLSIVTQLYSENEVVKFATLAL